MRVATWNVNSVKQRMPRLLPWLDQRQPDVVCLQETKLADDAFTALVGEDFASRGYEIAMYGEPRWNGVAILSRVGLADVVTGIAGAPGFPDPEARPGAPPAGGTGCGPSTCPTAASPTRTTTATSWPGWRRSG